MSWKTIARWGALAALILAICGIIGYLVVIRSWWDINTECQIQKDLAQKDCDDDNFADCIKRLQKALEPCGKDDRVVTALELEARAFKAAIEADEIERKKDKEVIKDLEFNLKQLNQYLPNKPQPIALKGILYELQDRPTDAIDSYKLAAEKYNFPKAYNSWGNAIYKWHLKDDNTWLEEALAKFTEAKRLKPDYPWPYVNAAAVLIAAKDLKRAEENLQEAQRLLPDHPRVFILWGQLYGLKGHILQQEQLQADAQQYFRKAADNFKEAKRRNPDLAEVRFYLGAAYEELGLMDDALNEYEDATKLGPLHAEACLKFAQLLKNKQRKDSAETEEGRCLTIIAQSKTDLSQRLRDTEDEMAKRWLRQRLRDEY